MATIPLTGSLDFRSPEIAVRSWKPCVLAADVMMPETAMHENDRFVPWEDNVGLSRQLCIVETETIAVAVKQRPDTALGLGVLAANTSHDLTAHLLAYKIQFLSR
jgi:hypothetical protein